MSVKFEKETIKETNIPGGRKHDLAHEIGEKFTGGKGQTGYLAVRYFSAQESDARTQQKRTTRC